jgi:[acyl-carrier-protein] S-malonyltransferase
MGILFSRGPELALDAVHRLCLQINQQGRGAIGISSHLSPNTVLLLGEGDTIDQFKERMTHDLPGSAHVRKNADQWPPLHTPLLWSKNIPDRAAQMMHTVGGGFSAPKVPVLSLVTGELSYNDYNSRDLLRRWIDEPQRLWDGVTHLLTEGTQIVVHVGPAPNLLPATFKRLSDNVQAQMASSGWQNLGLRAMSGIARRPWLAGLLTERTALLRAPFVTHVILEDWLLAHPPG